MRDFVFHPQSSWTGHERTGGNMATVKCSFSDFGKTRLLQGQKYPLQKRRRTLQPVKLINQVNKLVFVNYNYRIRSSSNEGELGMKYKVTHVSTLSGDWVKTLSQRLIASYLQRNVFYLP